MIERIRGLDGLDFWIPTAPNLVTAELQAGRAWEPYLSALYPLACRPDAWTIEVGAYCGEHTIELLRYSRVLAFEPQEIPFACLTINCALRQRAGWRTSLRLLYDQSGERLHRVIYLVEHPDWIDHPSQDYVVAVCATDGRAATSLDEIWHEDPVNFLKIDAQGCDLPILRGGEQLVQRWRPIICCEFEPALAEKHGHTAEDYRQWFAAQRYEIWGFPGGNLLGVPGERVAQPFVRALRDQGCEVTR